MRAAAAAAVVLLLYIYRRRGGWFSHHRKEECKIFKFTHTSYGDIHSSRRFLYDVYLIYVYNVRMIHRFVAATHWPVLRERERERERERDDIFNSKEKRITLLHKIVQLIIIIITITIKDEDDVFDDAIDIDAKNE